MAHPDISIGELASRTSTSVPTIRYYEEIGLLPKAHRGNNGYRYYRDTDVERLSFARRCRDFGFPIEQVKAMVTLFDEGDSSCLDLRELAQTQLESVRLMLVRMKELESTLATFISTCDDTCRGGATRGCSIVTDIGAYSEQARFHEVRRS